MHQIPQTGKLIQRLFIYGPDAKAPSASVPARKRSEALIFGRFKANQTESDALLAIGSAIETQSVNRYAISDG